MDKRIIAPAIFAGLAVLIGTAYASVFLILPIPLFFKVIVAAGILTVAGAMVYVIIQRKRELKEEDKDDLGKY
jgi:pilus assembly protein TadC